MRRAVNRKAAIIDQHVGAFEQALQDRGAVGMRRVERETPLAGGSKHEEPAALDARAIVNTASISGLYGDYRLAAYNAAKGGVVNLTKAAAIEYARKNIRINAVCPGGIETPPVLGMLALAPDPVGARKIAEEHHPIGRLGKPEEIARVVLFLASDDSSFMTGSIVVADGGATAWTGMPGPRPE